MRLWLRDSERLPDPPPMKTDDRAALGVGTVLWVIAAIAAAVFAGPLAASGHGWVPATAIVGVVYAQVQRSRAVRREHARSAPADAESERP
jgi:hypothetical protein